MFSLLRKTHTLRCRKLCPKLGFCGVAGENGGMNIHLNGELRQIEPALSLIELLAAEGLAERRVAVEVNGEIVPRSQHATHPLQDGDVVEIVHALGGG